LVSRKKCPKTHYIREGKKGDKRTGITINQPIPSYVLMCNNTQVGAMDGSPVFIEGG